MTKIAEREGLELLNEERRKSWKQNVKKASVLDLAWVTATEKYETSWKIIEGEDTGSDHALIRVRFETGGGHVREIQNKLQYSKSNWETVRKEVQETIDRTKEEWKRARNNGDVEEMARIIEQNVEEGVEKGTPEKEVRGGARPGVMRR